MQPFTICQMKKIFVLISATVLISLATNAQTRHLIRFKDKQGSVYSLAAPSAYLSEKSISRRARQNIPIDSTDLPVNPGYLNGISGIPGATILSVSKWLNQVLVETSDAGALNKIMALPFVIGPDIRPIATRANGAANPDKKFDEPQDNLQPRSTPNKPPSKTRASGTADDAAYYGASYDQIHIHEGEYLHNLGFRGEGISIAIIDAGFSGYLTNPAFEKTRAQNRIKGEYDFVNNEYSVNEDHSHGLHCFSTIAADLPGVMVGSAPQASFYLYRTEDVTSESIAEEQLWASAAEKADSVGADMISSSLGYISFDDPSLNHSYAQRNGNTALITNSADLAAKKGMIVMAACGNSGTSLTENKYVMCPADGDSVITVGAVDAMGQIAGFSSWGPNGAGLLKPNIVSVGKAASYITVNGTPGSGNGTSIATPNIAGLIACLWQAFREFSNMDIKEAVEKSASKYNNPDERYGYGIPNFRAAYALLQQKREAKTQGILKDSWIKAFPLPVKTGFTLLLKAPSSGNANIQIVDLSGRIWQNLKIQTLENNYYYIPMTIPVMSSGMYYLRYNDGKNKATLELPKF